MRKTKIGIPQAQHFWLSQIFGHCSSRFRPPAGKPPSPPAGGQGEWAVQATGRRCSKLRYPKRCVPSPFGLPSNLVGTRSIRVPYFLEIEWDAVECVPTEFRGFMRESVRTILTPSPTALQYAAARGSLCSTVRGAVNTHSSPGCFLPSESRLHLPEICFSMPSPTFQESEAGQNAA